MVDLKRSLHVADVEIRYLFSVLGDDYPTYLEIDLTVLTSNHVSRCLQG